MALTPEQIDLIANKYLVGLFQEMEQDVISDIARRVRKTGRLTETAELMAQSMANQGFAPAEIRVQVMQALNADSKLQAEIAKNTLEYKKVVAERINQLVEEAKEASDDLVANAGRMCYNDDLALWREAGKQLDNTALPQIIEAIQAQTRGEMRNLTQTTALALRDASGVPVNIMDGYKRFLDKTTLEVATGNFSANEAINRTIKEMAKSGIRYVEYTKNGRTIMTELDVATRRAVRTGVSQMAGRIMEENVKNSDTDLVITSQHMGSRPEHAHWQNKVFSLTGKDKRYKTLAEGTGYGTVTGLKGANCTHNFYPYWPGFSIKEPDIKEPPPVEINGRTYTYYQATQKQREYERKLRATKREIAIQEQSGGKPEDIAKLKRDARALSKEYNSFSSKAGLRPKPERARVAGVNIGNTTPSVPKPVIKTMDHQLKKMKYDDQIDWIMTETGVDKKTADRYRYGIESFTHKKDNEMRQYQFGTYKPSGISRYDDEIKQLVSSTEEYIDKAPKWVGESYRGLGLSESDLDTILSEGRISNGALTSWTSAEKVARVYAEDRAGGGKVQVIFHCTNQKNGTPIQHLSHYGRESEILVSGKSEYTVVRHEKIEGITHVFLKED